MKTTMDNIRVHKRPEGVLTIAIDRPERRNALGVAMYDALSAAVEAGEADAEVRVLLLHGAGAHFTSGNDIADFARIK
jgi:enoyl-CoA hydratase/carnithine racemase